jgi:hypothetical protein
VQIEKKQNPGTRSAARDHAATFPARLALARWTHGGDTPHLRLAAHDAPTRAGWFDRAQDGFQAWLEAGGFHQSELDGLDNATGDCLAAK